MTSSAIGVTGADPTFADYRWVLRRRGWIVALGLLAGLLGGLFAAGLTPKSYQATTTVHVQPTGVGAGAGSSSSARLVDGVNLDTEAQLVQSARTADQVRSTLSLSKPSDEILRHVSVTVPANSSVLNISYEAHSPAEAQSVSLGFANAYLAGRAAAAKAVLAQQAQAISANVAKLQAQLTKVTQAIATLPDASSARSLAQAQQGVLLNQINNLNAQLTPVTTTPVTPGAVISAATQPQHATSPSLPLYLGGGAAAGLLLGLVLLGLAQLLDHRLHGPRSVERALGVTVLAQLSGRRGGDAAALAAPGTAAGATMDGLRNLVVAAGADRAGVLVCSVDDDAMGELVGAGLAAALARGDGHASLLTTTGIDSPALSMVGASLSQTDEEHRMVGTASAARGLEVSALDLRDGLVARAEAVLDRLRARSLPVVVAAPPVATGPTAQALAVYSRSVLLVVRDHATHSDRAADAVRQFEALGVRVLGVVLVPRRLAKSGAGSKSVPAVTTVSQPLSRTVEVVPAPAEPEPALLEAEPAPPEPEPERALLEAEPALPEPVHASGPRIAPHVHWTGGSPALAAADPADAASWVTAETPPAVAEWATSSAGETTRTNGVRPAEPEQQQPPAASWRPS